MTKIKMTEDTYRSMRNEYVGVCTVCGSTRDMTEPDADNYPCPNMDCEENKVRGMELLLVVGQIEIVDTEEEEEANDCHTCFFCYCCVSN